MKKASRSCLFCYLVLFRTIHSTTSHVYNTLSTRLTLLHAHSRVCSEERKEKKTHVCSHRLLCSHSFELHRLFVDAHHLFVWKESGAGGDARERGRGWRKDRVSIVTKSRFKLSLTTRALNEHLLREKLNRDDRTCAYTCLYILIEIWWRKSLPSRESLVARKKRGTMGNVQNNV